MENNDIEKTVVAVENEGLAVSEAAEVAAGDGGKLENGGGGGGGFDQDEGMVVVTVASAGDGGGEIEFRAKRKRGRPRKQLGEVPRQEFMAVSGFPASPPKRGRGRPRGSGKWQTLAASLGGTAGDTAGGSKFTPYIIVIQEGENIVERIWSFSQTTPESICVLSASGTVSSAEILLPSSRGGILRYEGQFSIVSLNGSHTYDEKRVGKICHLTVQLAYPDGRLCGGAIAGPLVAAGPTQLVIATFRQTLRQQPSMRPHHLGSPTPNNGTVAVAVPLQAENGKASDGEVKVLAIAQRVDEVVLNGPNVSKASPAHPVDWKPLQRSAPASDV